MSDDDHDVSFDEAKKKILLCRLSLYICLPFCELDSVQTLALTNASAQTVSGGTVSSVL